MRVQACATASSTAVEIGAKMSVPEIATLINSYGIHVLVDLWGWAPLGTAIK